LEPHEEGRMKGALLTMMLCGVGALTLGCGESQGTNWGTLNPVGINVQTERGDNSPGDEWIIIDVDSGTCDECDGEGGEGPFPNLCSVPSGTDIPDDTCQLYGGFRECQPCSDFGINQ